MMTLRPAKYSLLLFTLLLSGISCKKPKEVAVPDVPKDSTINVKDYREKYIGIYEGSMHRYSIYNYQLMSDTILKNLTFKVIYSIGDSASYYMRNELLYKLPAIHVIIVDNKEDTLVNPSSDHNWGLDTNGMLTYEYSNHGITTYKNIGGFQSNDSLVFSSSYSDSHVAGSLSITAKKVNK